MNIFSHLRRIVNISFQPKKLWKHPAAPQAEHHPLCLGFDGFDEAVGTILWVDDPMHLYQSNEEFKVAHALLH